MVPTLITTNNTQAPLLWCWLSLSSDAETVLSPAETVSLGGCFLNDEILEPNETETIDQLKQFSFVFTWERKSNWVNLQLLHHTIGLKKHAVLFLSNSEIFTFLYYANEESDDVIDTVQM